MKILALSQVYYPDSASVSQHLTDLLESLHEAGHELSVLTSVRDYERPNVRYPSSDFVNGVKIHRLSNLGLGKKFKIYRLIDFLSFNFLVLTRLLTLKKYEYDIIIGLTSPPLLSYIGLKLARLKKIGFVYWAMDLQPELSIVANYIKEGSFVANFLQKRGDFIFKNADKIIALDYFMQKHIVTRGEIPLKKVDIIPVWPVLHQKYEGDRLSNPFRVQHGFGDKTVIMYSGNHSVMHPLTTLLEAATILKDDPRFLFVHIGAGVNLKEVVSYRDQNSLKNIVILPYQPRESIHISLASADIQVVSLGNNCVGFTHPNKIYGSMFVGRPVLYLGPEQSHISEILEICTGNISVKHDDVNSLVRLLIDFENKSQDEKDQIGSRNRDFVTRNMNSNVLIGKMIASIESIVNA